MFKNIFSVYLFLSFFLSSFLNTAQNKFVDKNGILIFEASETIFQEIKAINKNVSVSLDFNSCEIKVIVAIRDFDFSNNQMYKHFNKSYLESDIYPNSNFKGCLINFNLSNLTNNFKKFKVIGTLNLHGIKKEINAFLRIKKVNNILFVKGKFIVQPEEFEIKIPNIVKHKIDENMIVYMDFSLNNQKKTIYEH